MEKDIDLQESEKKIMLQILKTIRSIKYGEIQIIIHNSNVVQIDKTEKTRFDKENSMRCK